MQKTASYEELNNQPLVICISKFLALYNEVFLYKKFKNLRNYCHNSWPRRTIKIELFSFDVWHIRNTNYIWTENKTRGVETCVPNGFMERWPGNMDSSLRKLHIKTNKFKTERVIVL
jgi:hypothetical protein